MIRINKLSKFIFFTITLLTFPLTLNANSMDFKVKDLLNERAALSHAWQLSNNYSKGLTVVKDPFKALAWQYVYVTILPHAYPGLSQLLKPFKAKVPSNQHNEAFEYAKSLISNYHLPKRMDENQLIRVFRAKEEALSLISTDPKAYHSFNDFLMSVSQKDKFLALRYKNKMATLQEDNQTQKLVYGRLIFNGAELPETAFRNQALEIDRYGFFIGEIESPLKLSANGYDTYNLDFSFKENQKMMSLGLIALNALPKIHPSSIVGSVFPIKRINEIALTLKLKDQYINDEEPWFTPTIRVTTLDNGQFYIKDLSAGNYELIIKYKNTTLKKEVALGISKIKTLSTVNL